MADSTRWSQPASPNRLRRRGIQERLGSDGTGAIIMTVKLNHRIDGEGPHVLLLHAVGVDLSFLDVVTAKLARGFTVLRADLRGHGKSPYAPAASLDDYADDVHALLTE